MREILTQEEVDALLNACDAGQIEENPPSSDKFHTPFDFLSRKTLGGHQRTALEAIRDAFVRGAASFLSGAVGREVRLGAVSGYVDTLENFLRPFQGPSVIGLLAADPPAGPGILAMPPFLAYLLIDLMLGGDGNIQDPKEREFTALEIRMVRKLMAGVTAELAAAWSAVSPLTLTFEKVETNPKTLHDDSRDSFYVLNLRLEAESAPSRDFCLAVPFALVERLGAARTPRETDPVAHERSDRLRRMLGTAPVEVSARLGEALMPIRKILSLGVGDVIATDREVHSPVCILVEGRPKMHGLPGISRGRRAVKISAT